MRAEIRNIDGSEFVDMANLDRMSIKELRELGQKVEALIETKTKEEKIALVEKMRGMAAEMGLSLDDVLAGTNSKGRKRKTGALGRSSVVRYRDPKNPENTWSGRGRRPIWMGKSDKEQFAVAA